MSSCGAVSSQRSTRRSASAGTHPAQHCGEAGEHDGAVAAQPSHRRGIALGRSARLALPQQRRLLRQPAAASGRALRTRTHHLQLNRQRDAAVTARHARAWRGAAEHGRHAPLPLLASHKAKALGRKKPAAHRTIARAARNEVSVSRPDSQASSAGNTRHSFRRRFAKWPLLRPVVPSLDSPLARCRTFL